MPTTNRQIVLARRPDGWVSKDDFELRQTTLGTLEPGDVQVRAIYMSLDPYMRGRMDDAKSYATPFQLGEPLKARVIGEVTASRHDTFRTGEVVLGTLDWADHTRVGGGAGLQPIPASPLPLAYHLGALGMPGMTAWIGMQIGQPKAGETVLVSAASGAVGQIAGQIGKLRGCRVVGSTGSDAKAAFVTDDLGFDGAFNYRTQENLLGALERHCPDGIDVYFDNVGGALLEAALDHANPFARFVECGMISQYNLSREDTPGIRNLTHINRKRITMQGFIVSDHVERWAEFTAEMTKWLEQGTLNYRIDVAEGLEAAPGAFIEMLKGGNFGKQVVRIGPEP